MLDVPPPGETTVTPIIAVAGTKGGTGKSTVTISLAVELHRRGYRVMVADADDLQRTAATWHDVASEHGHRAPDCWCVDDRLDTALPQLAARYDVALLDLPGRLAGRVTDAYAICDLVLVPCGPSAPDLWALATTLDQIRDVQRVVPTVRAAIVLTQLMPRTVLARSARSVITGDPLTGATPVCVSELHTLVPYPESIAAGLGPTTYAPHSRAAIETRALATELARLLDLPRPTKRKR